MSCLTLALSIFFRLKHRKVNILLKNLSANVTDKTFSVYSPYPKRGKIIQNFLPTLAVIVNLAYLFLAFIAFIIYASGLLISLIILLTCFHLMFVDFASETFQTAKDFIKAAHDKAGMGVGDLEVIRKLKRIMPKLSNYYLFLSVLFLTLAVTKSYIWSSLLWLFLQPISVIFEVSELTGVILSWQVAVLLYSAMVFIILVLASKIKSKVLSYIAGSSSLES